MTTRTINAILGIIATTMLCGGAKFNLRERIPWGEGKDGKLETPMKVVAFWADTVLNEPGKMGTRGFGGRLLFYGKDPNKPVRVKGTLTVYAFDEDNRDPKNVIPDKKFVFLPDQFQKTGKKAAVGYSYNVWIPWDEVGGVQKNISLIARFQAEEGGLTVSESAKHRLPGVAPADPAQPANMTAAAMSASGVAMPTPMPLGVVPNAVPNNAGSPPPQVTQAQLAAAFQQAAAQQPPAQQAAANNVVQASANLPVNTPAGVTTTVSVGTPPPELSSVLGQQSGVRMSTTTIPLGPQSTNRIQRAGGNAGMLPQQNQQPMGMQQFPQAQQQSTMPAAPNMLPVQNAWQQAGMPMQNALPVQNPMPAQNGVQPQNFMPQQQQASPMQAGPLYNPMRPPQQQHQMPPMAAGLNGQADYPATNAGSGHLPGRAAPVQAPGPANRFGSPQPPVQALPFGQRDPARDYYQRHPGESQSPLGAPPEWAPPQ
jgi:hypothetical protein